MRAGASTERVRTARARRPSPTSAGWGTRRASPAALLSLYYQSVGRGASLLLNVPPDRRGLVHETDLASLEGLPGWCARPSKTNLAAKAGITASSVRGNHRRFDPRNLLDGDPESYWASDDAATNPEITLDFGRPVRFNLLRPRERLPLGAAACPALSELGLYVEAS